MKKVLFILILFCQCARQPNSATDANTSVPSGDPAFTPLTTSWIIDRVGVMEKEKIKQASAICQGLQNEDIAEVVVLIQNGVKHPSDYATHYGRWLRLGKKGLSTEGGNNGVVWLIRPDVEEKMTYSIGRGLPRLTSDRMVDIMNKAKDYLNFNNYDKGVLVIVEETGKIVRELYGKGKRNE